MFQTKQQKPATPKTGTKSRGSLEEHVRDGGGVAAGARVVGAALTDSAPGTTPRLTLATPERGARGHRRPSEGR